MSKFLILCGALLCLSFSAAAQESTAAFDASTSASDPAAPASLAPVDREPWQLGIGFQYQHQNAFGGFHTIGYNSEITRYLNDWFGVEGAAAFGFGSTPATPSLDAKSFFIGGGPHIVLSNSSRFEPWVHVVTGWEHFRFTQTKTQGSNSGIAFYGGGGVDYKLGGRGYWRIQADYIGSHFGKAINTNYSFGTGLVFNF